MVSQRRFLLKSLTTDQHPYNDQFLQFYSLSLIFVYICFMLWSFLQHQIEINYCVDDPYITWSSYPRFLRQAYLARSCHRTSLGADAMIKRTQRTFTNFHGNLCWTGIAWTIPSKNRFLDFFAILLFLFLPLTRKAWHWMEITKIMYLDLAICLRFKNGWKEIAL